MEASIIRHLTHRNIALGFREKRAIFALRPEPPRSFFKIFYESDSKKALEMPMGSV
jgi:hypothetical protein